MVRHVQFDDVDDRDVAGERADSFQLEQFRTLDFVSAMQGELVNVITNTKGIHERYLPLVAYFCTVNASQYVSAPTRSFRTGVPSVDDALAETYQDSRINLRMRTAQQQCVGQNAVLLLVEPVRVPRKVRVTSWISGEYVIEGDPMLEDVREAKSLVIRWPLKRSEGVGVSTVTFGRRVYTPDQAYLELPGGDRRGLFNPNNLDDLSNPYGYVPAVLVRRTEAPRGWMKPRLPLDLLQVQLAVNIACSDIEHIVRQKSAGREVLVGPGASQAVKKALNAGPGVWSLDGDDLQYQVANIDPRIDRYREGIELLIKLWSRYRFTSPDGMWASTGITGAAKAAEQSESYFEVQRQEGVWQQAECDLAPIVRDLARIPRAAGSSRPRCSAEYHYPTPPMNDLQDMQALALGGALGQLDLVKQYAHRNGVPMVDAESRYFANLKRWNELLHYWTDAKGDLFVPPGIDSIASQVLRSGQAGRPEKAAPEVVE